MRRVAKYIVLGLVLSAVVWLTACERVLVGSERDAVLAFSEITTDNLFAGLAANDYVAFSRDLDADMRREIPLAGFAAWKQNVDAGLGTYLDRQIAKVTRADEFYVVTYDARFERADLVKLTVVFHSAEPKQIALVGIESEQLSWSAFQSKR